IPSLDSHDARGLGRAEADREYGPERDRHLPEDVPWVAVTEDALDPVDEPDRLDATLEHGEERAFVALVRRVLARSEGDIRRGPGELVPLGLPEIREHADRADLLACHHLRSPPRNDSYRGASPHVGRVYPALSCVGRDSRETDSGGLGEPVFPD